MIRTEADTSRTQMFYKAFVNTLVLQYDTTNLQTETGPPHLHAGDVVVQYAAPIIMTGIKTPTQRLNITTVI